MVGVATPAWAHATLLSSGSGRRASVPTGPASITLRFSEHVLVDTDAVRVVAESGGRVDTADAHTVGAGDTVVAGLRGGLATGTYLVSWHVISADTHPVSGGFSFGVGVTPAATVPPAAGSAGWTSWARPAGRWCMRGWCSPSARRFLAAVWPAEDPAAGTGSCSAGDWSFWQPERSSSSWCRGRRVSAAGSAR